MIKVGDKVKVLGEDAELWNVPGTVTRHSPIWTPLHGPDLGRSPSRTWG